MPKTIERSSNQNVSWLELFFDLVFVALVAQLTYQFSYHHHTLEDFIQVGLVGYMIFMAWIPTTANINLRKNEDIVDVLFVQLQMVMIMTMSLTLPQAFGEYSWLFFGAMAVNSFLGLAMTLRRYRVHPKQRPKTLNVWWGFFVAAVLWGLSGLLPTPYLYIMAGCALLLNITAPMTTGAGNRTTYLDMNHLLERLGLFLLLVMGEAVLVVALVNNVAKEFDALRLVIVLCGLLIMVCLWWLYFPYINNYARGNRAKSFYIMLHTHGFLYGSLILVAGGLKIIIENPGAGFEETWIFLGGLGLLIVTFNIIRSAITHHPWEGMFYTISFLIPLFAVGLASYFYDWAAYQLIVAASGLLLVYTLKDYLSHFSRKIIFE